MLCGFQLVRRLRRDKLEQVHWRKSVWADPQTGSRTIGTSTSAMGCALFICRFVLPQSASRQKINRPSSNDCLARQTRSQIYAPRTSRLASNPGYLIFVDYKRRSLEGDLALCSGSLRQQFPSHSHTHTSTLITDEPANGQTASIKFLYSAQDSRACLAVP